ncbi:SET and MYND domain-containing protein 4 [Halotydeus destructor]|nr:SET and MYND domain-containing protein 4 [Halotydeus destructor]
MAETFDDSTKFDSVLRLARKTIEQFDTSKFLKSAKEAETCKLRGNGLIKSGDTQAAIKAYNEAIVHCPTESSAMALLVANRSLALFQLNKFRDCLDDIQLAIKHGYPDELSAKLLKRQKACSEKLQTADGHQDELEKRSKPELVKGSIQVVKCESKGGGRGVLTTRKVLAGELLLAEKAFTSTVLAEHLHRMCHNCMAIIHNQRPFPCRKCVQVRYCGLECEVSSWKDYHSLECGYLDLLETMDSRMFSPKMVLKMITRHGGLSVLKSSPTTRDGLDFGSGYSGFCDLAEHKQDPFDYNRIAIFIVAFLSSQSSSTWSRNELISYRNIIVQHIRRCQVNSMHFHERFINCGETDAEKASGLEYLEERRTGCGLFLAMAMTNHSCDPNAKAAFFDGDIVNLIAIKDIDEGEELSISYGMFYKWHTFSERQSMLRQSYFFECQCPSCIDQLEPTVNAYKCSKCSGPVIMLDEIPKCLDCKQVNTLDVAVISEQLSEVSRLVPISAKCLEEQSEKKLLIGEKLLVDAHSKLKKVLFKHNTQIAITLDMLAVFNKKLKRNREAINHASEFLELTKINFDEDVYMFNATLKLLDCYILALIAEDPESVIRANTRSTLAAAEQQLLRLVPSSTDVAAHYTQLFREIERML